VNHLDILIIINTIG